MVHLFHRTSLLSTSKTPDPPLTFETTAAFLRRRKPELMEDRRDSPQFKNPIGSAFEFEVSGFKRKWWFTNPSLYPSYRIPRTVHPFPDLCSGPPRWSPYQTTRAATHNLVLPLHFRLPKLNWNTLITKRGR